MANNNTSTVDLPSQLLDLGNHDFRDQFNRCSFELAHHLSDHPLLTLPRLLELRGR